MCSLRVFLNTNGTRVIRVSSKSQLKGPKPKLSASKESGSSAGGFRRRNSRRLKPFSTRAKRAASCDPSGRVESSGGTSVESSVESSGESAVGDIWGEEGPGCLAVDFSNRFEDV